MNQKILIIAFAAIFASCKKSSFSDENLFERSGNQVTKLTTATDRESQKQVFNLMSTTEKYSLWANHLITAKNQFTFSNETGKVKLIEELLSNLSAQIFENDSRAYYVFTNYYVPVWQKKAEATFSPQEFYDLLSDPTATTIGLRTAPIEIGEIPIASCFCNVGTSGFSCARIVLGISPTYQTGICERNEIECKQSNRGCGFLWLSACDGNRCNFG